jgi:type I restriction-modification system DNA methylase subunit
LLAACALAAQTRETEYLEEAKRWSKDELAGFASALGALIIEMEDAPFTDILGGVYVEFAQAKGTRERGGEFYTPQVVSQLMARMLAGSEPEDSTEPIALMEPCCGAGGMILAYAESLPLAAIRRLRVTAIDINRTACHMCFINTTLWGIPTRIHHMNALSNECWGSWSNIHYLMPWLPLCLTTCPPPEVAKELPPQGEPASPEEVAVITTAIKAQQEVFSFA